MGAMGRQNSHHHLLTLLLPVLVAATSVDPETSRLLAEVNGGLAADSTDSDSVGESSISRHDVVGHFPAGLAPVGYDTTLPFGARTRPSSEHPLNEHFSYLDKVRRKQYGDIYSKHPKLHYKPKYYKYPKHDGVKYHKSSYDDGKYDNHKYSSYKYEKPKYKELKYKSYEYPRHKYATSYEDHTEYVPKSVYEAPKYHHQYEHHLAPEPSHYYKPPPPHYTPEPHPAQYGPYHGPEGDYPVLPPPPTAPHHLPPPPPPPAGHHAYPAAPETFHYTEEHHVTETYPAPPVYPVYSEPPPPPPRGHRGGKSLDRFSFNPEPYIETIAIAYHENERNFNSHNRQPKHLIPEYTTPRYQSPHHEYRPPHVQQYAPRAPKYVPRAPEYGRHVPYAPPHASEYVAPEEHVAPQARGYGRLVGGHATPERTVTLTPYRVQVGTLYGLASAGSSLSETVVSPDGTSGTRKARTEDKAKAEVKSGDNSQGSQKA
ncbi:extensin-3-like [Amphibalanus amphitrite]|uniref:extensin-3-like n=1 Tax=Amphibalanus amphitrite TaxID=1232801 RepID=UPI001C9136DC|nr:extensin-3-like [Amphibalanus amphitrite]